MQNKKSQVEDWLPTLLIIVVLVIAFIMIAFAEYGKTRAIREKIEFEILNRDANQLLRNFLTIPSQINPQNSIADEINNYFISGDENALKTVITAAHDLFQKSHLESDYSSWSLEINYPAKKEVIIETDKAREKHIQRVEVSRILMPTSYPDKKVEMRLFFVQTKFVAK